MEKKVGMNELVELVFDKKPTIHEKLVARNSLIPASLMSEDFLKKLRDVLYIRKFVVSHRWKNFFDDHNREILFSHEKYLMHVMFAFLYEYDCNQNIFDSFVSVCVLVIYFSEEILEKTGVDFSDLNPDIIMVFYRNVLKKSFYRPKDFYRFVEYIRDHKYLKWKSKGLISFDKSEPVRIDSKLIFNLTEELGSHPVFLEVPSDRKATMEANALSFAQEVLSKTSVELPTLPNEHDLIKRLVAYRKRVIPKAAERRKELEAALISEISNVAPLHGYAGSDDKTNYAVKRQENIAQHENIVQAVIRYNQAKKAANEDSNNRIQKEAGGVLEHLEDKIKSLIEVLDNFDKE
ncbi:unnamed protein product [Larinioides sclopetarius]|uniref:Uncharacterized protein n=1 Tax=Larinioides sclopetarius TaxID=280406 RepID=A0AAV2BSX1_9ARAC